jgi:hypothetical protein
VRRHYGLSWSPARDRAFRMVVRAARAGVRVAPKLVTRGWNRRSFDMVAETERRRIARGKPTPQIVR